MIITIKIDTESKIFHELMNSDDVYVIQTMPDLEPTIQMVGPYHESPFDYLSDEMENIGNIYDRDYDDAMSDFFDDSKYWYNLDILKMARNFLMVFPEPFIKTLFYRKCFMVLKDFRNIRRCYNF